MFVWASVHGTGSSHDVHVLEHHFGIEHGDNGNYKDISMTVMQIQRQLYERRVVRIVDTTLRNIVVCLGEPCSEYR